MDDGLIAGRQQQGVQVGDVGYGLSQCFVKLGSHFLGDDVGQGATFPTPGGPTKQGMVKPPIVLEGGVDADLDLFDHTGLADDVGHRTWCYVAYFSWFAVAVHWTARFGSYCWLRVNLYTWT